MSNVTIGQEDPGHISPDQVNFVTWQDCFPRLLFDQLSRQKDSFEWWYFDFDFEDGSSLVFMLKIQDNSVAPFTPHLHIEYIFKEGDYRKIKLCRRDQFAFSVDKQQGIASIKLDTSEIKIHRGTSDYISFIDMNAEVGDLQVHIRINPLHRGLNPTPDCIYMRHKKNPDLWTACSLIAPRISAKGEIKFKGKSLFVNGEGYHDHPWGTDTIIQTMGNWHWGRLFMKTATILFLWVLPAAKFAGKMIFCYYVPIKTNQQTDPVVDYNYQLDGSDWKKESKLAISFPHACSVLSEKMNLKIDMQFRKNILNFPGYNRSLFSVQIQALNPKNLPEIRVDTGSGWKEWAQFSGFLKLLYGALIHKKYRSWFLKST